MTMLELRDESIGHGHDTRLAVSYPATRSRLLDEGDAAFMLELLSDPTIAWYEPLAVPATDAAAPGLILSYIRKASDPSSVIIGWSLIEQGRRVGVCQLRREGEGFLVGASLLPSARGRGLGTAVFEALAALGYTHLDARHVAGEVEDDNIASIRALGKASYVPTDRYRRVLDNGRVPIVTRYTATRHAITLVD
jgi:RimJ/RimL family protein N-acetyltransferase